MADAVPPTRSYSEAVATLRSLQKTSKGAPAYSRFVNRPLGRRLAAAAYVARLTPDQVTMLSAFATFAGIALVAFAPPTVPVSLAVSALLVLGYALDSADGQLARLRGGGSPAGEWLDHVIDAVKIAVLHLAVLLSWYRHLDAPDAVLLVPLLFGAVASVHFCTMLLTDHLRRAHRGTTGHIMSGEASSSTLYSLAVLPTDYGLLCLLFALMWWQGVFVVAYGTLGVLTAAFLLLALPKWYLEMRSLGRG